jgi:hypothetical protein
MNIFLVFLFIISLLCSGDVHARRKGSIIEFFDDKDVIKAYVSDVVNSSGDRKIDVKKLKNSIEEALRSRLSHTFEIVKKKDKADIIINTEVLEYLWTEHDPVDTVMGFPAMVYDAVQKKNYACMKAIFIILDAKDGAQIWRKTLRSTITKSHMTEKESYNLSNERIAKIFLWKLLKKPRLR